MTNLSINLNKIALLRNSRGRNYPSVVDFAEKFISQGVQGLTIHPRQDQRHITTQDAVDLTLLLESKGDIELNIEGYPSTEFLSLVEELKPAQCSLVPDGPGQLTSDHGWNLIDNQELTLVRKSCDRLNAANIRTALFLDPEIKQVQLVPETGAARIELYTETYASNYGGQQHNAVFHLFRQAASKAQMLNIGVNAGHDLDLNNLDLFLSIPNILEVSIGHALIVECIESGIEDVIQKYLNVCR